MEQNKIKNKTKTKQNKKKHTLQFVVALFAKHPYL
jgi:hypothetical protein